MKKHMLAIASVVIALSLLTACQPTPEKAVVVNKNEGKLEEKIRKTPEPQTKYEVPRSWKENVEVYNGKLKIEIDADVEIPDVKAYPVLKVVPGRVSQEMADKIVSILYGEIPVYELEKRSTKSELQDWLIQLKAEYKAKQNDAEAQKKTIGRDLEDGSETMVSELEFLAETIKELEGEIDKAPETAEEALLDTEFKTSYSGGEYIAGKADKGHGAPAIIQIQNGGSDYPFSSVSFYDDVDNLAYYTGASDDPPGLSFSKEDAVQKAVDFLNSIGVTDMRPAHVEMLSEWKNDDPVSEQVSGYRVHFEREAMGIQVPFRISMGTKPLENRATPSEEDMRDDRQAYKPTLPAEHMSITICEDGIRNFEWQGITEVKEAINENSELLPFDDIKDRFSQMMAVKNAYISELETEGKEIRQTLYVDHIKLGYARVPMQNDMNTYMFVPAWAFYGETKSAEYTDENGELQKSEPVFPDAARRNVECLLAVNALDGSVVDAY